MCGSGGAAAAIICGGVATVNVDIMLCSCSLASVMSNTRVKGTSDSALWSLSRGGNNVIAEVGGLWLGIVERRQGRLVRRLSEGRLRTNHMCGL